ncbi:Nickel-binding periplasmic protein precursor [Microbacterium azadirachtae]|uniref:Nickel-binding periplasmic protein n=1 Tax=Microbacterium azadirachtae TaxID=582680 RepID=A0A0F0K916_9MICO|nr:ABC transporter substrate-binding protein [Microbacterium azadirachtae]KJL17408.1 Nickel-binding periplasmic protein precursor [Microbacterium azadirachtae]
MPSPLRRRILPLAALAAAAALALSACSGSSGAASSDANGELVWGVDGSLLSAGKMDPQTSQLDVTAMVQRAVLDSLVFQKPDGSFVPWLAKKWEVSEDGTAYTFHLRDDVTFTDGEKFDAAAVKANFDRIADPATKSAQAASMLGGELYKGTEVIDPTTVKVTFSQPYAPFLQAASTAQLGFYAPQVLKEHAADLAAGGKGVTVGTGPFRISSYTPDQEIVYTRNAKYSWAPEGMKAPEFTTLRVQILPEASVRSGSVTSGEIDLASQLPPNLVSQVKGKAAVTSVRVPGLPYSLFLNEKNGVFSDQKVREAFTRAIDVDTAVDKIFFGQFPRAWSILGPTTPGYDKGLEKSWPFDKDRANALLDEAGWTQRGADGVRMKDGHRLTANWIAWTPVSDDHAALANAVQSDLKAVGFEITRETLEPGAYNAKYGPKTFDITDWDFSGVDPDLLRPHLATDGFQNASSVSDPRLDQLLKDGIATTDDAARAKVYAQVQEWNAEQDAIVPLYVTSAITAAGERVSDLTFDIYGRPLFFGTSVK